MVNGRPLNCARILQIEDQGSRDVGTDLTEMHWGPWWAGRGVEQGLFGVVDAGTHKVPYSQGGSDLLIFIDTLLP